MRFTRAFVTKIELVLFKLKPGVTSNQLSAWTAKAKSMVGQIPGLQKLEINTPLASTASRGQGFNMGLVAILDQADDVKVYAEHPAHLEYVCMLFRASGQCANLCRHRVHKFREELCDDTLAYDLEFHE